jgi:hypothetical protein
MIIHEPKTLDNFSRCETDYRLLEFKDGRFAIEWDGWSDGVGRILEHISHCGHENGAIQRCTRRRPQFTRMYKSSIGVNMDDEIEEYLCPTCVHLVEISRDGDAPEYLPHDIRVCLASPPVRGYWVSKSRDAVRCVRYWEDGLKKKRIE